MQKITRYSANIHMYTNKPETNVPLKPLTHTRTHTLKYIMLKNEHAIKTKFLWFMYSGDYGSLF